MQERTALSGEETKQLMARLMLISQHHMYCVVRLRKCRSHVQAADLCLTMQGNCCVAQTQC